MTDSMNLTKIIKEVQPDEIYKLAAMSHIHVSFEIPEYVANTDGTGVDIAIKNLAEGIKKCVGYKGNFTFNTSKPDGTMQKLTNVSKLNALGWRHKVTLDKGVEKMYAWCL